MREDKGDAPQAGEQAIGRQERADNVQTAERLREGDHLHISFLHLASEKPGGLWGDVRNSSAGPWPQTPELTAEV